MLADVASTRPHDELEQVVQHFLDRLDPDGTEPDPTEQRAVSIAKHADGSITLRADLDAVGGEKVQAALESIVQASRPKGDLRTRAQQLGDALVQWADNALAAGGLPILRRVKPHVVVTIDLDDLVDPATGPGAARTGFGAQHLRRPRPLAGLRRQHHPHRHRPRRPAAGRGPRPSGCSRRTCAGPSRSATSAACSPAATPPAYWCDVHHLARTGLDDGQTDRRERRPALRTPPHQGPPRLPGRATPRRPMAHLPPRRHRDRARTNRGSPASEPAPPSDDAAPRGEFARAVAGVDRGARLDQQNLGAVR